MLSTPDGLIVGHNPQSAVDDGHGGRRRHAPVRPPDRHRCPARSGRCDRDERRAPAQDAPRGRRLRLGRQPRPPCRTRHQRLRRHPPRQAQRPGSGGTAGRYPGRSLASGTHDPQAAHEAGPRRVPPAQGDCGARLRSDQGGQRFPALPPAGPGHGDRRVAPRMRRPQPRQAVPQRPSWPSRRLSVGSRAGNPGARGAREAMARQVRVQIAPPTVPIHAFRSSADWAPLLAAITDARS